MPRSPTVLTPPPGTLPFVPNTTIESGKANAVWLDLYQDGNTPRPVAYGGTGASNAEDALNNLGAIGQNNFLAAFSIGDGYWSTRDISAEGGVWLKRDGSLYLRADYPDLSSLLPLLPDGVTWENVPTNAAGDYKGVAQGPDRLVAIARSSSNSIITTSIDGDAWDTVATLTGFVAQGVSYGGGIYVAVDGNGKYSPSNDGETWATPATLAGTSPGIGGSTFGAGLFVLAGIVDGNVAIWTSDDGSSWTERLSGGGFGSGSLTSVNYVNDQFIATGSSGRILTSPDGITWTSRMTGSSDVLYAAAYAAGLYVVVGTNGAILTSTNTTVWTARTSGTTSTLNSVAGNSLGFLAVGSGGVARLSNSAGTSWNGIATGTTSSLAAVIVNEDNSSQYIVVGPSTNHLYGIRTLPTQFRVPNDAPQYGWIKADND